MGPLYPLMVMPLTQINEDTLKVWHDDEAKMGPDYAARALMMFRGFLRWAASKPEYRDLVNRAAGSAPAILDSLPSTKANKRKDCLEVAQLPGWFAGADMLGNRTIAGAPAGAIAQVMGHSPDSIAEGYRPRSIDALRPYLAQIEAHILEQAGIVFDAKVAPGALRVVNH